LRPELTLALVWLAWWVSWGLASRWTSKTLKKPEGQGTYYVLIVAGMVLLFGFWRNGVTAYWHPATSVKWALVGLAAAGFLFCWWARLALGRLWSASITRKEDHRVIDTGPYALVRHPIYTGVITAGFASAVMCGTLIAAAGFFVFVSAWYLKARMEEKFLRAELGAEAYDAYAARVPMLIPFLKF
jgi:protein-S-isoprenylcysteine O-methyltransferase Ste14